jgi:hypothetical protein
MDLGGGLALQEIMCASLIAAQKSPIAWVVLDRIVADTGYDDVRNKALSKSCAQTVRAGTWD